MSFPVVGKGRVLRRRSHGELIHVCLAQHDRACRMQLLHHRHVKASFWQLRKKLLPWRKKLGEGSAPFVLEYEQKCCFTYLWKQM